MDVPVLGVITVRACHLPPCRACDGLDFGASLLSVVSNAQKVYKCEATGGTAVNQVAVQRSKRASDG